MRFKLQRYEFTTIPKSYLKDKNLTLKGKGLLTIMFSLSDDWNYNTKGLCTLANCGEKQIKNTLKELENAGYLEIIKDRNNLGRFEYIYHIYYKPIPTEFNIN